MIKTLSLKSTKSQIDFPLIVTTVVLLIFGLIVIYDASIVASYRDFGDRLYYLKNQLVWASLGIIAMTFFSLFDYHKFSKIAPILFLISIFFLVVVLVPQIGTKIYGARRWISFFGFNFQPSEFAKLALILYQTRVLTKFQDHKIRILDVFYVLFLPTAVVTTLVLAEPDLGSALILISTVLATYFIAGGPIWHFLILIPITTLAAAAAVIVEPYRLERLRSYLNPTFDPQGASYQIRQILIAIASGGAFGVGIGSSRGKFDFIPEVQSDAIFAVVAEELGFVGALLLISLLFFLITRAIAIARGARDFEGKVLATGIAAAISIQTLVNLASMVALTPLTGVPLPLISYGGSSLLITASAIGILVNIKRQS